MERTDLMQAVANVGTDDCVWSEDVIGHPGNCSVYFPEEGEYKVILMKIGKSLKKAAAPRRSARDFIGYCRRYHPEYRSTADIMKELREGEEIGAFALSQTGLITRNESDFKTLYPSLPIYNPERNPD